MLSTFLSLVPRATIAAGLLLFLVKVLGKIRVGKRRNCSRRIFHEDDDVRVEDRETGLMEQWYTDQPCQRVYGLLFAAPFSPNGIKKLANHQHVNQSVLALIRRHPILTTTVLRNKSTGRASLRNTYWKKFEEGYNGRQHPLGDLPVKVYSRINAGSWHDVAFKLTHTDMDESSWPFRIAILLPNQPSKSKALPVEIFIATNHLITDGLSSLALMKDFIIALSMNNFQEMCNALPVLPLVVMDERIDMRPPLHLVATKVTEDRLPKWLRKPLLFWQGPKPNVKDPCEGHFATVTVPPLLTERLLRAAKAHKVTMNGLLSTILLAAEAALALEEVSVDAPKTKRVDNILLKYLFPLGRGTRSLCDVGLDQTGAFIAASEHVINVPSNLLQLATSDSSESNQFWKLAQVVTESARRDGVRDALDFLSLLNFIPTRDSFTGWLISDGSRCNHGRRSSLEISNLGVTAELDALVATHPSVSAMFGKSDEDDQKSDDDDQKLPLPEVYLINGRNYRGSVLHCGVATTENNLCIALHCQLGQCGCEKSLPPDAYYQAAKDSFGEFETRKPVDEKINIVCPCPKNGLLNRFSKMVEAYIDNFAAKVE